MMEELLADVKNYLNITWDDQATDRKIGGLIKNGIAYLDLKRGAPANYGEAGLPRTLLFDYVRYARDVAMRNESLVKNYALESTQPAQP